MLQTSLANVTDIVGKCHGYRWHMPCIIAAYVSFFVTIWRAVCGKMCIFAVMIIAQTYADRYYLASR